MYYIIMRDLGNGYGEYVSDIDTMSLTADPAYAQQISQLELAMIDMGYLNAAGFMAVNIANYGLLYNVARLFRPRVRSYRPRVAPPPRRPMPPRAPRAPRAPRGPMAGPRRPVSARPVAPAPAPRQTGPAPRGGMPEGPFGRAPGGRVGGGRNNPGGRGPRW